MPRRKLNQSLERLKSELSDAEALPDSERQRLETLVGDVIRAAEGEADEGHEGDSISDRLQEARERFEESHPNVTLAIGAVADALSRLGI